MTMTLADSVNAAYARLVEAQRDVWRREDVVAALCGAEVSQTWEIKRAEAQYKEAKRVLSMAQTEVERVRLLVMCGVEDA